MELIAKLKWQCRRGTKELDYLLEGYLKSFYLQVADEERVLFEELLNMQDSILINYLLGEQLPESKELVSLVKKIRKNN